MTTATQDFSHLRALAEAAAIIDHNENANWYDSGCLLGLGLHYPKNTRFIEAANPATVLTILYKLEALQAEVARLEEDSSNHRDAARYIGAERDAALARLAEIEKQTPVCGWLIACDEEMIGAHIGVANLSDSYASAKAKLRSLIDWHVAVATDPAVNGGFSLQVAAAGASPVEPSQAPEGWSPSTNQMTSDRAAYFMRRFKREEKLLGPNEQAAVDYVITLLEQPSQAGGLSDAEINAIADQYPAIKFGAVWPHGFARAIIAAINAKESK